MVRLANPDLTGHFVELIRRTSVLLPEDVVRALERARETEPVGSSAVGALDTILKNVEMARELDSPVCQDTGTPIFDIFMPVGYSLREFEDQILSALRIATQNSYLRPNAVDSVTGKNSGDNTGKGFPTVHFHEWTDSTIRVELTLKGGGSENVGAQYKLPDKSLNADRDLKGVRNVVLDAIYKAQGQGCSPGIIGVAIGGDRGSGFVESKRQLFRRLGDVNPDPALAALEQEIMEKANALDIGPMGFGGNTTVLGVKVGAQHRLPACFFVSVSYMCWACRRRSMEWRNGEVVHD